VVNHPEFFLPAATPSDDMPNELAYEPDPEPALPGRVLMRVIDARTVCIVDGLRYETDAEFEPRARSPSGSSSWAWPRSCASSGRRS
jgi:hypothetical protein